MYLSSKTRKKHLRGTISDLDSELFDLNPLTNLGCFKISSTLGRHWCCHNMLPLHVTCDCKHINICRLSFSSINHSQRKVTSLIRWNRVGGNAFSWQQGLNDLKCNALIVCSFVYIIRCPTCFFTFNFNTVYVNSKISIYVMNLSQQWSDMSDSDWFVFWAVENTIIIIGYCIVADRLYRQGNERVASRFSHGWTGCFWRW